jgi:hypothetical protein
MAGGLDYTWDARSTGRTYGESCQSTCEAELGVLARDVGARKGDITRAVCPAGPKRHPSRHGISCHRTRTRATKNFCRINWQMAPAKPVRALP